MNQQELSVELGVNVSTLASWSRLLGIDNTIYDKTDIAKIRHFVDHVIVRRMSVDDYCAWTSLSLDFNDDPLKAWYESQVRDTARELAPTVLNALDRQVWLEVMVLMGQPAPNVWETSPLHVPILESDEHKRSIEPI